MSLLIEQVKLWPAHALKLLGADAERLRPAHWQHFATSCTPYDPSRGYRVGATVWVSNAPHEGAAIAWEWAELREGVLAIADPNSLASNIDLIGTPAGLEQADPIARRRLVLNTIVHGLPWQTAVLRELQAGCMVHSL